MVSRFNEAADIVLGHEGNFQAIRNDRGNWTSGKVGVGELKGTKYGITAMTYPSVDIKNLTLDEARAIYKRDFWDKINGDALEPALALVAFDTAINSGVGRAIQFLNQTNDVTEFLNVRRKFVRGLRLYNEIANAARGTTWGKVWENRINTLEQQAAQWKLIYPVNGPTDAPQPQEGASKVIAVYNRGAGEKIISERFEDDSVIINPMGNKVYITLK